MDRGIPIRAISRAIVVLQAINRHHSLTLMEIATETKLPYPTVCRIVQTLLYEYLIEQEPAQKKYRVTALVKTLSVGYQDDDMLVTVAHPLLIELCRKVSWPVSIATRVGNSMVLRDTTHAMTSLTFSVYHPGFKLPLLESASGKAYAAFCAEDERQSILKGMQRLDSMEDRYGSVMLNNAALLDDIRRQGYATQSRNQYTANPGKTSSLAVPVLYQNRAIASLTMSFFANALTLEGAAAKYLGDLQAAAAEIGQGFTAAIQGGLAA
ncbi:MAG: helix-turn-helix domain-containing protein [Azospirillaceae bacterium]|nr:helix-turn-helix domain-containing protein [Azospirillaceae bacterium]